MLLGPSNCIISCSLRGPGFVACQMQPPQRLRNRCTQRSVRQRLVLRGIRFARNSSDRCWGSNWRKAEACSVRSVGWVYGRKDRPPRFLKGKEKKNDLFKRNVCCFMFFLCLFHVFLWFFHVFFVYFHVSHSFMCLNVLFCIFKMWQVLVSMFSFLCSIRFQQNRVYQR